MEWHDATKETPPVNEKWHESEYMLCIEKDGEPFVGWFNNEMKEWYVAHWKADSLPVEVTHWMPLPNPPSYPQEG